MGQYKRIEAPPELPSAALLSNGRYSVVVEADGGGHSSYEGRLLTPWLGNGTTMYVQDAEGNLIVSAGSKAVPAESVGYDAAVGPGSYRIRRDENGLRIVTDICVVPDRDAELRRFTVSNRSARARRLALTVVTQVAAALPGSVEIEHVDRTSGVMAVRAEPDGGELFWLHAFVSGDVTPESFGTDRETFYGSDGAAAHPPGLDNGQSTATGGDPLFGLRLRVDLEPGNERSVTLACCASRSRQGAVGIAEALTDRNALADAFLEAALHKQRTRDDLKIGPRNADRFHRVGVALLRGDPLLQAPPPDPSNDAQHAGLPLGRVEEGSDPISKVGLDPDRPLAVCRVSDESEMYVANLMLKARAFWHSVGLSVQVLFLNDKSGVGADALQQKLHEAIELDEGSDEGVVLRHADVVTPDDQRAIQKAARLVLTSERVDLLRVRK